MMAACVEMTRNNCGVMESLHPAVSEITPQGLTIAGPATAEDIGLDETDERLAGPLAVHLELRHEDSAITVSGTMEGTALRQCVRCLTDYEDPINVMVYADYLPHTPSTGKSASSSASRDRKATARREEPTAEETDEQDELYYYQGDHVDLTSMLREQIILAAPMQPLCREDCAGLCPMCGQNLNDRRCACGPQPINNPFRVLRERQEKRRGDGGS